VLIVVALIVIVNLSQKRKNQMAKCSTCGHKIQTGCDWRQGRCPHRKATHLGITQFFSKLIRKIIGK